MPLSLWIILTLIVCYFYVYLIIYILKAWSDIPEYTGQEKSSLNLSFLIPARNEANNIIDCIESIQATCQGLPHSIEIIIVDDHSTDDTALRVSKLNDSRIILIRLADEIDNLVNAYKKVALATGMKYATGDYIIQLDADVVLPENYLRTVCAAIHNSQADMIAAPVLLTAKRNILGQFQILDLLGMMAVTGAGIDKQSWYMANGANMIYRNKLVTYSDDKIASGDDIFSIQKIAATKAHKIVFLKSPSAAVETEAMTSINDLYQQRIRWATKNKFMKGYKMQLMMGIPFINALLLICHLFFWLFFGPIAIIVGLFHWLVKAGIDYIYLLEIANYYKKENSLKYFIPSNVFHVFYIAIIGTMSLFQKNYIWKGRKVH